MNKRGLFGSAIFRFLLLGMGYLSVCVGGLHGRAEELRIASVFSDHMVLQRDKPVRVWGWADEGSTVTVNFAGREKQGISQADGTWSVTLEPLAASGESRDLLISCGNSKIRIGDVLVGEVWLLGGQSNMEMPLWWRGDADGLQNAKDTRLV